MLIRDDRPEDAAQWVACRVLSFLDCSYFDDVHRERDVYDHDAVRLVAEEGGRIVGFLDAEYERRPGEVCYFPGALGAVVWNLGVLPEARRRGVAGLLWQEAQARLRALGIARVEVWTQDDEAANRFYQRHGFVFRESYLNVFIDPAKAKEYLRLDTLGPIFGVRALNVELPADRRAEAEAIASRLHEVRVYEKLLNPE